MTLGSILLATALLLLVGVLVLRPVLAPTQPASLPPSERERLSAEKEAILTQIRALDFDYETGKIPEESYQRERLLMMQAAADKLRQMDGLPKLDAVDARIEAAVATLRGKSVSIVQTVNEQCPQCGNAVTQEDRFCRACGEKLYVEG